MKIRYFVAVPITLETVFGLKEYYRKYFYSEIPIKNVHMSLISTFFLQEGKKEEELFTRLKEIKFLPFMARFSNLGVFEQKGKRILYVKVVPEMECGQLSKLVEKSLNNLTDVDTFPFTSGVVPTFEAHVTLNYDFNGTVPSDLPELSFLVEKMVVYKEQNGEWVECGLEGN